MNSTLDTVGQAHIGEITRAGRHLLDLINDLLDIARIESGHAEVRLEPVQVRAMIDEAVALLGPVTTTADVHLLVDDVEPQIHVHADRRGVRQVMLNLLSNAVKYNVAGGEVRVSAESTCAGRCRVAVHDTGRGIAPADRERVFQPFVRLEHHDDPIPGSGLGLALCKQLLATMHGDIDFESTVGAGSRFWFDLPVAPHAPDGPAPS
jgi:signal transduction histidine kinase